MTLHIVILISGNGTNLQAIINYINNVKPDYTIKAVISNKKAAYGLIRADLNQIPTYYKPYIRSHRPDHIDFGREMDGSEDVHDIEGRPATRVHPRLPYRDGDYLIPKRRYSAFFGTDLEILLKGLKADTLILCGELTDVCVHYTFVDAHQHNYYTRVIEDCVGGSTREAHEASLNAMEYLQTGARCTHSQAIEAFNTLIRKSA